MIVHQFRAWARTASPPSRADGARALARAYLYSDLAADQKREAIAVLTGFLDDPSPLVRRALAEAFAVSPAAPHHIVLALADDQASIAAIVLLGSPVLSEAELIDCAATADEIAQQAIASRPTLSGSLSAALAETGAPSALVALARNREATIPAFSMARMIERHGDVAEVREALLSRDDLPSAARLDLVAATMRALGAFVTERNWMSDERVGRVAREAKDKAAIVIAQSARSWQGALDLASHLRRSGDLTVGFAFRAILSGRADLFKATLSELSGTPIARVDGLSRQADSAGFAALYRKASLPLDLLPAFRIALQAAGEADWTRAPSEGLSCRVIERVLTACQGINGGHLDKLLVLLRRFESEAAREEARAAPARVPAAPRIVEPLVLEDLEAGSYRAPAVPSRLARGEPTLLTIDMAALEAELCAA